MNLIFNPNAQSLHTFSIYFSIKKEIKMTYKVETTKTVKQVTKELKTKARETGFSIIHRYNFKQILYDSGYPIEKEITVFELCNPPSAHHVLTQIAELSAYLPCKISIYEENGKTCLVTIGLDDIITIQEIDEAFQSYISVLFGKLKTMMHSWDDEHEL